MSKKATKTKKKTPKKVANKTENIFSASIKVLGKVYESTGSTVSEALTNLRPLGVAKGVSLLSVFKGDVRKDKILNNFQTFRLFNGGRVTREVALRNTSLLFHGI